MKRSYDSRNALYSLVLAVATMLAAGSASADLIFGEPVRVEADLRGDDGIDCLSSDGLEMYIDSQRSGGQGEWNVWVLRRASIDDDWGPADNLGPAVNSANEDSFACISADGLTLYFSSNRPGGYGNYDIYMTTRASRDSLWGAAVNLGPKINGTATEGEAWVSPDGLELYFESYQSGGYGSADIYVARRATVNDPWGEPANLGPVVNSAYGEQFLSLSPDGLLLFFSDHAQTTKPRPGGCGGADIWMARRASLSEPWQTPVNLGPQVNGAGADGAPRVSLDGRVLYFWSNRGGAFGNWQAPILPVCDFNGDGSVDVKDLRILAMYVGTDDTLCDIGPFAWGDGVVGIEDVKALVEHIDRDFEDPTLIAHWAMDETEGTVVRDSTGRGKAFTMGNPVWRPAGGQVHGALALDGIDDFIVTGHVPDLGPGPVSIVVWVQGGGPGQSLLFHMSGAKWLYLDPLSGNLTADFRGADGGRPPLVCDAVITDGRWHRIGLVWDGVSRILYVDGQEVATDSVASMTIPENGFMIGGGIGPGTYWSGLIDDVRIYNRVVRP